MLLKYALTARSVTLISRAIRLLFNPFLVERAMSCTSSGFRLLSLIVLS